ncbi:MAG: cupin domain-containing protein [Pseudomonadota bacterium]
MITSPIARRPDDLEAFRIAPEDTNYFAPLLDPVEDGVSFTLVVEIYEPQGATPPNAHAHAVECFYVLEGTGTGRCGEHCVALSPGSMLALPPGQEHIIENTGPGKLYALCLMVPNEDFAELIRGGERVLLTDEDRAVLARTLAR